MTSEYPGVEVGPTGPATPPQPATVGERLRAAREALGLTRADIARSTKIAERQLLALEEGNYAGLPSRTYTIGFARSYARAVKLDEAAVVADLRIELDGLAPAAPVPDKDEFKPGDPKRVPGARIAWLSALAAVIVAVAAFVLWRGYGMSAGGLPSILPTETPTPLSSVRASTAPAQASAPAGPVVFTAEQDKIWVKFYDAAGQQLMQKQMAKGQAYTVPAEAKGPMLWTGRPDALSVTIGGKPVAKIADREGKVKDVPVSAAALLARPAPGATPTPSPAASAPVPAPAKPSLPHVHRAPVPSAVPSVAPSPAGPATSAPTAENPSTTTP
jgi:cytoskeletal protein RodZ